MKKIKCDVCKHKFLPTKEKLYEAREFDSPFTRPTLYDAMDCPVCGCQNILQVRFEDANTKARK